MNFEKAIVAIQKKHAITFSYDRDIVSKAPVFIDTTTSLERFIQQVNERTAFMADKIDANHYLLKPKKSGGNFLVRGYIEDEKTTEPIYSASILSKATKKVSFTDENGYFHIILTYSENDTLVFSSAGYEKKIFVVNDFLKPSPANIKLKSTLMELSEYTVMAYLTTGINYEALDNSIIIRPKKANVLTGMTDNDLLGALDALPGISMPDGKPGNLNIRGSSPDQTMVTFDNIPVYQKGHLFGTVSAFNSNMVDNVKVYRSFVSANHGGRAGGLIEINSPSEVANKTAFTFSASMLDASLYTHVPIVKNKASFFISGRKSLPYEWNLPPMVSMSNFAFQYTEVNAAFKNNVNGIKKLNPNYDDIHAKIIVNAGKKHKLEVSGLVNNDNMDFYFLEEKISKLYSESKMHLSNTGLNSTFSSEWSKRFTTNISLTGSKFLQRAGSNVYNLKNKLIIDSEYENEVDDLRAFIQANLNINEKNRLTFGYDLHHYNTTYIKQSNDSTNTSLKSEYLKAGEIHTAFINYISLPLKWFDLNAGLRVNYFKPLSRMYVEPRLCLGFKLTNKLRLKFSGGYQNQFVAQVSGVSIEDIGGIENPLWMLADKVDVPVVSSYQASGGIVYQNKGWLIDMEGYYRFANNLTSVSLTDPNGPRPYIHGSVQTYGCDVLIRKSWENIDLWTSYTISKSMMQFDSVQAEPFYSLNDQTHILDVAATYHIKRWRFSLSWKYRTGLAALPGIRNRMTAGANSEPSQGGSTPGPPPPGSPGPVFANGIEYKNRFPDYHSLDAFIGYEFQPATANWKGTLGASAINCYNQKNIIGQIPQFGSGKPTINNRYSLGFTPNVVLTIKF
ncbi:MAG TPA: carboxypeptidase-like regulatory domain-containing protein [Flavobacteriales bacterium]|nr:carboxypeptidase-like regulatory domain-containing protein [Flavobacteriales bacterium]